MVAPALSRFVIGIGFDTDRRSENAVGASFDRIRNKGLQLGAALAGAFSIKGLVATQGKLDTLSKQAGWLDMSASSLQAWGAVVEKAGGSTAGLISQLDSLHGTMATLRTEPGAIEEWAKTAGLDPSALINAKTPDQLLQMLSGQLQSRRGDQMALRRVSSATGLDMATVTALSEPNIMGRVADERRRRGITGEQTDIAARYQDTMQDFGNNMEKLSGLLAEKVIPPLTNFIEGLNRFLESDNWIMRTFFSNNSAPASSAGKGAGTTVNVSVELDGQQVDNITRIRTERNHTKEAQNYLLGGLSP